LAETPVTAQLKEVSSKYGKSVIGVMEVPKEDTDKYGIVDGSFFEEGKTLKMQKMVEKPRPDVAPTNLATPGRYILTPEIFDCLRDIPRGVGGEYQLTDAINMLAGKDEVYAHIFDGDRFDTGSINGYLNATVEFALRDPNLKNVMIDIIKDKIERYSI
jgi:UTP--glucose-1-phosphate uridylyltransferase